MKEEKENIEDLFGGLRRGQPFRVPEGYFETFSDRLKQRISEERYPDEKKPVVHYLKPALKVAAALLIGSMLMSVPFGKFKISNNNYVATQLNGSDTVSTIPATFFSYFSDDQFITAVEEMDEYDSNGISSENLADYISANYDEYEIIANN